MPRPSELTPLALSFLVNGILFHSLLPRFPEIVERVGASAGQFGLVLTVGGVGGLVGAGLAPVLGRRFGVVGVTGAAGLLLAGAAFGVAAAPSLVWLGATFVLVGSTDALHDVSMNELAVASQHRRATSIMGRLHGIWSLGATAAAAAGAAMVALGVPVVVHVGLACVVAAVLQIRALGWLTAAPAHGHRPDARSDGGTMGAASPDTNGRTRRRARAGGLVFLALLAAVMAEQTPLEWAALMVSRLDGSTEWLASAAPAVFSAGVLLSRGATDRLVDRLGAGSVLRAGNLVAATALTVGLVASTASGSGWPLVLALPIAGAGVAANFPLLFSAGDRLATSLELPAGTGTSVVGMLPRLSGLLLPAGVGAAAELLGLGVAIGVAAAGAVVAAIAVPALVRR